MCLVLPPATAQTIPEDENERVQNEDFPLANNNFWVSSAFRAGSTDNVQLRVTEAHGRNFDLLMMKTVMLKNYERVLQQGGGIQYYESHSRLNTRNVTFDEVMPNTSGQFIFVIDNTEAPDEGGYANDSLNLTFALTVSKASPGPDLLLSGLILGLTGLVMALVRARRE